MKKICIFMSVMVLMVSLFTGCGCTPQKETMPTIPPKATSPTVPATVAPTIPATQPATEPATDAATMPLPDMDGSETGVIGSEEATTDASDASGPMEGRTDRSRRIR